MLLYCGAMPFTVPNCAGPLSAEAKRHSRLALLYALASGLLAIAIAMLRRGGLIPAGLGLVAALLPLVPLILFMISIVRMVRSLDELQRLIHLEAVMLQFGASGIVVMGYGMLARAGFAPNVTFMEAYPFLWLGPFVFWALALVVVRRRYQ
jgi:hypothetical protein